MIRLTDEYKLRTRARAVPGSYFDPDENAWVADLDDTRSVSIALELFPHIREQLTDEQLAAARQSHAIERFDAATPFAEGETRESLLPNVPDALRDNLYEFQWVDLGYMAARLRSDGGCYIGWDRGLGKTCGAITLGYELGAQSLIIVTPSLSKEATWRKEIEKWDVEGIYRDRIYNVGNSAKAREDSVEKWTKDGGVLLVHYEAVRLIQPILGRPFIGGKVMLIIDEAHRLSNGSASYRAPSFYKALKKLPVDYKVCLSGSVIINSAEDFFGALHLLFPKVYKSKWRDWNDKYLEYVDGGFGKVLVGIKPDKLDDMRDELSRVMVIRDKHDELPGLPERINIERRLTLNKKQRKVYEDIAEDYLATLPNDEEIIISTQLEQLAKLRQVSTALELLSPETPDSSKYDYAMQVIEDTLPNKTLVFCWHRDTVDTLTQRLRDAGINTVSIHGGVKVKDRQPRIDAFTSREPESARVMVATIKTIGESINLMHSCADLIFVESSWTAADMDQAADRIYRIGQDQRVTITTLIAEDTVDETKVLPTVASKADLRRMILGGPDAMG